MIRWFIFTGVILFFLGFILNPEIAIPCFGRFPGDMVIKTGHKVIFLPFTTSALIGLILTFILWVFKKR